MKATIKAIAHCICVLVTAPFWLLELLCARIAGHEVLFPTHLELLSLVPGKVGSYMRTEYLSMTLVEPVRDCMILFGTVFTHSDAIIRRRVYIGLRCCIGSAIIGEDTMISDHVQILSGRRQHGTDPLSAPFQQQEQHRERVSIGKNCWIGAGAVIMADVGDNAIIGAGSVVVHPIPGDCVAVGSPACVVKSLSVRQAATLSARQAATENG